MDIPQSPARKIKPFHEVIQDIDRKTGALMALLTPPEAGESFGEQILRRLDLQTQAILALAERLQVLDADDHGHDRGTGANRPLGGPSAISPSRKGWERDD